MAKFFPTNHTILRVTGQKSANFLHGQLTNDIAGLTTGSGNYNLLLTNKGKVRADLFVIRGDSFCDLIVPKNFVPVVREHLEKLAPLSRCELSDRPGKKIFHVLGDMPDGKDLNLGATRTDGTLFLFRTDRLDTMGFDVIADENNVKDFEDWAQKNSIRFMDETQTELIRIKKGIARVGQDVTEDNLPQEARLERALNFTKGCYLGQEIIARLHYKGHVNKILVRLVCAAKTVAAGDIIFDSEKQQKGIVTSVATDENLKTHALGYVPYKLNEAGLEFWVGGEKAVIAS